MRKGADLSAVTFDENTAMYDTAQIQSLVDEGKASGQLLALVRIN
ncbi:hypothetical protein FACS1894120_3760 [Clostridia bacterium]|nr:hypothetical protein FACS1894120_3760 [Clostridia bacterium]